MKRPRPTPGISVPERSGLPAPPALPEPQARTMADLAPQVNYLAGFCCPLGGLAAGKPRVLCLGAEIFLSTGSELVYVYDQEAGLLTVSARPGRERRGSRARGGRGSRAWAREARGSPGGAEGRSSRFLPRGWRV